MCVFLVMYWFYVIVVEKTIFEAWSIISTGRYSSTNADSHKATPHSHGQRKVIFIFIGGLNRMYRLMLAEMSVPVEIL